jgi:hypothetical protein
MSRKKKKREKFRKREKKKKTPSFSPVSVVCVWVVAQVSLLFIEKIP